VTRLRLALLFLLPAVAGCSRTIPAAPSLAPRAAEAIDPRLPVVRDTAHAPVSPALAARLAGLEQVARAGDAAFRAAAAEAERLAQSAGAPESESWVAAQQALSAAQAAREPTTRALGDIDALAATAIAALGGLPPADLAAIEQAAARVAAIDRGQAERIEALQARLGA